MADELAPLLRLFQQSKEARGENADITCKKAFDATAAIGLDRLKNTLTNQLAAQLEVGQNRFKQHTFFDIFQAVFWALHAPSNLEQGREWMTQMLVFSIQSIHTQNIPASLASAMLDVLLREVQHVHLDDLPAVIEELLRGVTLSVQLQRQEMTEGLAIFYSIELLPQLLLRVAQCPMLRLHSATYDFAEECSGTEYKDHIVTKLFALTWPKRFFLQILKTFRDFLLSEEQEREFCAKIFREAHKEIYEARIGTDTSNNWELLPTIFYNVLLLLLRAKHGFCRRILINMLLRQCSLLSQEGDPNYLDAVDFQMSRTHLVREIRALQSTMLYHLDLVLKQDESISNLFMVEYELQEKMLTSFDIALLFTIANRGKYETKATNFLLRRVLNSYKQDTSTEAEEDSMSRSVRSIRDALLNTVVRSNDSSWNPIIYRMVQFGFQLLEFRGRKSEESVSAINQSKRDNMKSLLASTVTYPWVDFAIRLLLGCFHHEFARAAIFDHIVNSIIMQSAGSKSSIQLLARIIKRHSLDIDETLATRIRECLEYVTHMRPEIAQLLFSALSPLVKVRPNMKNFLILTLRKAMFRKDPTSRIIGIMGFSFLLCLSSKVFSRSTTLSQLYSQNTTLLLSQGVGGKGDQTSIATQNQSNAIIAEDLFRQFCGIFKRAFQLQGTVRMALYAELLKVYYECPSLRSSILNLVFHHYLRYYDENESILPPLKVDCCLARTRGMHEEPLAYLLHTLLVCVDEMRQELRDGAGHDDMFADDTVPSTQTTGSQNSLEVVQLNVSIFMERMKRCELTDFDLDQNFTFTSQTPFGETHRQFGIILLGIWEVCMNWTITSLSTPLLEESDWSTLIHYMHLHTWMAAKLYDTEQKTKGTDRKRGRPLAKQKMVEGSKVKHKSTASDNPSLDPHTVPGTVMFVTPSSIEMFHRSALSKLRANNGALSDDEEELLLFMLTKTLTVVEAIHRDSMHDVKSFERGMSLGGSNRSFLDRLGPTLFGIYSVVLGRDTLSTKTSAKAHSMEAKQCERASKIRCEALAGFGRIVRWWMTRSIDRAAHSLVQSLHEGHLQNEEEIVDNTVTAQLEGCVSVMLKLFDDLTLKNWLEEAVEVLDILAIVWSKLPSHSIAKYELWMKNALTRRNFSNQRVLDKMAHVFLRPHPQIGIQSTLALQLAYGLLHHCEEGDGKIRPEQFCDRLILDKLDEKCILTLATSILSKCEDAVSELDAAIKEFDSQQRRQIFKLKDQDYNLLQLLEDETGIAVLDIVHATSRAQTKYKSLCRRLFELSGILVPFVMMNLNKLAVSIRVIRLLGRLYKLLTVIVLYKVRQKDSTIPKYLQRLFDRTAGELTPALLEFIACINQEAKREAIACTTKRKLKVGTGTVQAKLIPEVIYQIEQFDVVLIKLSKLCKERDFSQWIRLRQSRDFRFNRDRVKEKINEDDDEKPSEHGGDVVNDESPAEESQEYNLDIPDEVEESDHDDTESADNCEDGNMPADNEEEEEEPALQSKRKRQI